MAQSWPGGFDTCDSSPKKTSFPVFESGTEMGIIDWLTRAGDWLRGCPPDHTLPARDVAEHREATGRFDAEMEALRLELEWHRRSDREDG